MNSETRKSSLPAREPARRVTGCSIAIVLVGFLAYGCNVASNSTAPNIVFIMADDLGYGHLGCYGQRKIQTPHVDRLAAQGMRFTQAYAGAPVCAPSRSVLMTGLHAGHTAIRRNGGGTSLADSDVTIAEILKQAGYRTGAYGKWGLGLEGFPGHPNEQGFDDFLGYLHQVHAHFYYPFWLTENHRKLMLPDNEGRKRARYSHDVIMDRALEFIRTNKDQRFFCYLPVTIPHVELAVPEDSLQQYEGLWEDPPGYQEKRKGYIVAEKPRATFAAMISRLDRDVGRLIDLLHELGVEKDTIVIFTSDNGAQSRYDVNEEFFNASGPLRGYKGSMYEGGLRAPLVVWWPGKIAPGTVSDHVTYFPDWMPTLAELAGVTLDIPTDGVSIVPTLLGGGAAPDQQTHEWLYWELVDHAGDPTKRAARHGDWKFVQNDMEEPVELYDLANDPGETHSLANEKPELVEQFEAYYRRNRTEARSFQEIPPVGVDDYVK